MSKGYTFKNALSWCEMLSYSLLHFAQQKCNASNDDEGDVINIWSSVAREGEVFEILFT